MRNLTLLCVAIVGVYSSVVHAAFLGDLERRVRLHQTGASDDFLFPNEMHPGDAAPIFGAAPTGVYFTAGTERGFMSAALSPAVTHLVIADRNPRVILYARINAVLLAVTESLAEYRHFRFEATPAEWTARAVTLDESARELLADPALHAWWRGLVASPEFWLFNRPLGPGSAFHGANYLFDEALWARLHAMAAAGRIAALDVDWTDRAKVRRVVSRLAAAELTLSVIDVSNIWYEGYAGWPAVRAMLKTFGPVVRADSIFLAVGENGALGWRYLAVTVGRLVERRGFSQLDAVLLDLQKRGGLIPAEISQNHANRLDPEFEDYAPAAYPELEFEGPTTEVAPRPPRFAPARRWCAELLFRAATAVAPD